MTDTQRYVGYLTLICYFLFVVRVLLKLWNLGPYSANQKIAQSLICMLIPLVGPIFVYIMLGAVSHIKNKSSFDEEGPNAGGSMD